MTENSKIPERCSFKIVELKKKGRQRTVKLELAQEFDEVVTNQRIMMIYDFSKQLAEIEEAEKDYHAAMHKNNNKLLDTDDESSLSTTVRRAKERIDLLQKRLVSLKEMHKDFDFTGKVIQHKLKFKDERMITEIIYMIDKKTIDRFDEFRSFVENYEALIRDYHEREKAQKGGMTQVAVDEAVKKAEGTKFTGFATEDSFVLVPEKDFGQPIKVDKDALERFNSSDVKKAKDFVREFVEKKINKQNEVFLAKQMKEIFDGLAMLFKGKIDDLKVILEGRRYDLERIKETGNVEKTILSIAIDEAGKCETGMNTMITLAAGFDFIEILKQYE